MRDLVLLLILLGACAWTLRRPWVGAITWTVVSLGSPHAAFGYAAADWPVATAVAACTLLGFLFTTERQSPFASPAPAALVALMVWFCLTLPFSFDIDQSLPLWARSMKIFLMLFITMALLDTRKKLDVFLWSMVASIGYFGVKGGLFTLATGGNYRIWGPGGFIGGNNELALALIMTIPMMRYLQLQSPSKWVRRGLVAAMILSAIAAIGTYSRGALLGMTGMLLFFVWRSDRKLVWATAIVLFAVVMLPLMPDTWWDRMDTLRTYGQDESALGRLTAWGMAWNLAKDRLMGGGFMVALPFVYAIYAPAATTSLVAHSIYFQIMGEHGFIGLFLFLLVGVLTWIDAARLRRLGVQHPDLKWAADLGSMMQVSMIGFAVTGAFLSMAYFDLPYNVMAVAALALRMARREADQAADAARRQREKGTSDAGRSEWVAAPSSTGRRS